MKKNESKSKHRQLLLLLLLVKLGLNGTRQQRMELPEP